MALSINRLDQMGSAIVNYDAWEPLTSDRAWHEGIPILGATLPQTRQEIGVVGATALGRSKRVSPEWPLDKA
jgi:hypothetical protein